MREKILAQLAIKYPGVSKQFLGLWADKLTPKVTEESQIEGVLNELDNLPVSITDLATEYQKEGDRRVTEAAKKAKPPTGKTETPKEETPPANDVPDWGKELLNELKSLKMEKKQASMKEKLAEKLKGEKIPESFYSRIPLPEKEDDLEAHFESIKNDFTALKQSLVNDGFSQSSKPTGGTKQTASSAVITDIKAWAEKGKEPEQKSKQN